MSKKLPIRKKLLIIFLALILVFAAAVMAAYSWYIHPTGEIMSGLYAVRTHNNGIPMGNFFILQMGEKYIAIDAGADNIETEIGLRKLGIQADDVTAVFITHAHWDHIGSLNIFDNAVIYTGNTENSEFPEISHQIMPDYGIIELYGMSIQCIYSPGHTIDSVCYLVDGKYLFVGDLFVTVNDPPPSSPKRFDKDLQLLYREKILSIEGVEYVFTGHFGFFKDVRFFRWLWL